MTIEIPDDLARGLEGVAAARRKSIEQLAVEGLQSLLDQATSPEVLLCYVLSRLFRIQASPLWMNLRR